MAEVVVDPGANIEEERTRIMPERFGGIAAQERNSGYIGVRLLRGTWLSLTHYPGGVTRQGGGDEQDAQKVNKTHGIGFLVPTLRVGNRRPAALRRGLDRAAS